MSGLIGNIFAFFMFNGQVVASRLLAKVLLTLTMMSQEYISTSVRTTVGIVLLVITLSGVAVMALLRYIKNILMLMMMAYLTKKQLANFFWFWTSANDH